MDLSKVGAREALKPRPGKEPHWQRLRPGCFLGYRPSAREGSGTWLARAYDEEGRRYRVKSMGDFGSFAPSERFTAARREAEAYAELVETGAQVRPKIETVEQLCRSYAEGKADADARFKRFVYGDPIAKVPLAKLRRRHLREWRERMAATPALISRNKAGEKRTRVRSASSINRELVPLRAALFTVLAPGAPDSEAAWQEALRPIRNADRQRTLYLDRQQRAKLLSVIAPEAEPFVRALCLLPLRPGAMAALSAGDFDKRTRELTIGKDKSGKPRRILLPTAAAALMAEQAKDKLPAAPLFMRANGERWDRNTWKGPIIGAAAATGLPTGTAAYTLRHSTITDLVNGGLAILTVAQISDTSVEMIERHYGHLDRDAAEQALAALAL